jgi:hypothetical protein
VQPILQNFMVSLLCGTAVFFGLIRDFPANLSLAGSVLSFVFVMSVLTLMDDLLSEEDALLVRLIFWSFGTFLALAVMCQAFLVLTR